MSVHSIVLLSRRHRLYAAAANWELPDLELFLFDSPSEALARVSLGQTALFLFDTRDYPRYKHVVRKFLSMQSDADLLVIGAEDSVSDIAAIDESAIITALPTDIEPEEIRQTVSRRLRVRRIRENSGIVGRSRAVVEMLSLVSHAAPLLVNILIMGESGSGKELVARAIHDNSDRATGPFVSLNCGAMSEGVLESELFGHAKGAFTGAIADHPGVFKRADGGTLFLDEVAEMPLAMQTRFLRTLETGEFTPVGGRTVQKSQIRLVAATNSDLADDVRRGRFRQDLYYRLKVVVVRTPPLRDRREDIPLLTASFLAADNAAYNLRIKGVTRAAEKALMQYDWPGNVRELRNAISSAVVLKQRGRIDITDLPAEVQANDVDLNQRFLPMTVPLASTSDVDLGLLAGTLLELQREVREIKAMLVAGMKMSGGDSSWPVTDTGFHRPDNVVETFSAVDSYSPLADAQIGDLEAAEKTLISSALVATSGNRRQAADRLGISERTLYRKIKLYDL